MDKMIYLRPHQRTRTSTFKEKDSYFLCPSNTVMTGRYHYGDENGKTAYEYCTIAAYDEGGVQVHGEVKVENVQWSSSFKESSGAGFDAPGNRFIVGRQHEGDEGGYTKYATAIIKFNGNEVTAINRIATGNVKESKANWVVADDNRFMTGRHHAGDENGNTYYYFSEARCIFKPGDHAPSGTMIIPGEKHASPSMKESVSSFLCPSNTVMTGRLHCGDENGETIYEYAELKAVDEKGNLVDGVITVEFAGWVDVYGENIGREYDAPLGYVIIGRKHTGDEEGNTSYAIGKVYFNGYPTNVINYKVSALQKESDGVWFKCDKNYFITARHHYGDENGTTYYGMGMITCDEIALSKEDVIVHVKHNSLEYYLPMSPNDYIRLCRLRRHISGDTDYGYNKNTRSFVKGNDKSPEYYDIPVDVIESLHPVGKYELMNFRPNDNGSCKTEEYFLEPYDNLYGDKDPNGRVCVMRFDEYGNKIHYWLFWGYDKAGYVVDGSHQGDWECITIILEDYKDDKGDKKKKIKSVSLSHHDSNTEYSREDLEITNVSGKDELTVFCADGSHALYNKSGTYSRGKGYDYADGKGYDWIITDKVEKLEDAPWKHFAGAWGEVGHFSYTTGPLGPWQKSDGQVFEVQKHNCPLTRDLVSDNQVLLVHDYRVDKISILVKESDGTEVCAEKNMVLYNRKHLGDENGTTQYIYSHLMPITADWKIIGNYEITIDDLQWSEWHCQSDSADFFISINADAPHKESRVITGRQHKGDENGKTRYQTGVVKCNGKYAKVIPYPEADLIISESSGRLVLPKAGLVIIGITHTGDENGLSTYHQGYIVAEKDKPVVFEAK